MAIKKNNLKRLLKTLVKKISTKKKQVTFYYKKENEKGGKIL